MRIHLLAIASILGICSLVGAQAPSKTTPSASGSRETTDAVMVQVEQAIEDEIYDYRREGQFFEVDGNPGGDHTPAVLSVYVSKELSPDGAGVAVYNDMPYGQIYRYFTVGQNGVVTLSGDPEGPFRNWGGSVLTVYMKTEDVCDFLTKRSRRGSFTVDPDVPAERLRLAVDRQIRRTGYSFRLNHGKPAARPRQDSKQ